MSGAGGREVGRISIRVVPDLDEFRAKVKAAVADLPDGEVNVHADASGVRKEVKAETAGMEAKVKVKPEVDRAAVARWQKQQLGALSSMMGKFEARAPLTTDGEELRKSLLAQETFLRNKIMKLNLELDPADLARARAEIDGIREFIERQRPVNVKIDFDEQAQARFRKNMLALDQKIQATRESTARASADRLMMSNPSFFAVDYSGNKDKLLKLRADLDFADAEAKLIAWEVVNKEFAVQAKIEPDVDMTGFARARFAIEALLSNIKVKINERSWKANDLLPDGLKDAADGISNVGGAAGRAGPGLFSFAGFVGMAALAIAVLLPPVLALASGLLTVAPAMAAIAVPIGAIMLGLDGIKKAAKVAEPAFTKLKEVMSTTFEQGMTPGFEVLRDRLIPGLTLPLQGVGDALSNVFKGFVDQVSSPETLRQLQNITDNVGKGFQNAVPGVQKFTDGFVTLIDKIGNRFPGMGEGFSRLAEQFSNGIDKFTTKDAVTGVSQLDTTLSGLKATWDEFSGLGTDLFKQGLAWMSDPSFGASMKTFFGDVRSFITETLPGLGGVFTGVAKGLNDLAPAFKAITPALEAAGKANDLMDKFDKANPFSLENLKEGGIPFKDRILDGLQGKPIKFRAKSDGFLDMFLGYMGFGPGDDPAAAAAPSITKGIDGIVASSQSYFESKTKGTIKVGGADPVLQQDGGVGLAVSGAVDTAISAAKTKLATFQAEFGGLLDTALAPLSQIPQKISTALGGAAGAMTTAFGPITESAYAGIQRVVSTIVTSLGNLDMPVRGALGKLAGAMSSALQPAVSAVGKACQQMVALTQGLAGSMAGSGAQAGAGFAGGLQAGMSLAVATVGGACQQIVGLTQALAGSLMASGAAAGAAFASGLSSMTGVVANAAGALMGAASPLFPHSPAEKGPFSGKGWVLYSGMAIGEGFADGINASTDQVVNAATDLVTKLNAAFNDGIDLDAYKGDVTQAMKDITVKSDEIRNNMNLLPKGKEGKDARAPLKSELDRLGAVRDQLKLQKDKMGLDDEADKAAKEQKKMWMDLGKRGVDSGMDIGTSVMQSFAADLGISGNGAIPTLLKQGLQFGSQYIFHVANMDDALKAKQQDQHLQSIGQVGRL